MQFHARCFGDGEDLVYDATIGLREVCGLIVIGRDVTSVGNVGGKEITDVMTMIEVDVITVTAGDTGMTGEGSTGRDVVPVGKSRSPCTRKV